MLLGYVKVIQETGPVEPFGAPTRLSEVFRTRVSISGPNISGGSVTQHKLLDWRLLPSINSSSKVNLREKTDGMIVRR